MNILFLQITQCPAIIMHKNLAVTLSRDQCESIIDVIIDVNWLHFVIFIITICYTQFYLFNIMNIYIININIVLYASINTAISISINLYLNTI
jgi:hypothetical protein